MRDDLKAKLSGQGGRKNHARRGNYPFRQSGQLREGIVFRLVDAGDLIELSIVSTAPYSEELNNGWVDEKGKSHGPFPFMDMFFEEWSDRFVSRLDQEVSSQF